MNSSDCSQRLIPLSNRTEWFEALDGIPHSFAHTWENCYAMHLTTNYPTFLYCCESLDGRIVCPIAERTFGEHVEAVTPYGFSGFTGIGKIRDFPSIWNDFAISRGWITAYITLNPLFDRGWFTDPQIVKTYNRVYTLDLTLSEKALIHGFNMSRRQRLTRWFGSGVSIITDRSRLTDFLLSNRDDFFFRKHASATYHFHDSTWDFLCELAPTYLVGAELAGSLECVILCAHTPHVADYLFNVSIAGGGFHSAGLLWNAIGYFQQRAVPLLNLGGGVTPDDGIAEFKRSVGGAPAPLRSLRQVFRPSVYSDLCIRAGITPGDATSYFPPYQNPLLGSGVR